MNNNDVFKQMRHNYMTQSKLNSNNSNNINNGIDYYYYYSNLDKKSIVVHGSSAGAVLAGSVLDYSNKIKGLIALGYPCCKLVSFGFLFGNDSKVVQSSDKPKRFLMGSKDEFAGEASLNKFIFKCKANKNSKIIIKDENHAGVNGEKYDELIVSLINTWIRQKIVAINFEPISSSMP